MPARTTLLIIFLTIFTSVLVIYSLMLDAEETQLEQKSANASPTPQPTIIQKNAKLTFDPNPITISSFASTSGSTNIVLNAPQSNVTGVQVELSYDPKAFVSITLSTPSASFWGDKNPNVEEFSRSIDSKNGRISYIVGLKPNGRSVSGIGNIVTLTYRVNPLTIGPGTTIKLLEKSLVKQEGTNESILGAQDDLSIIYAVPTRPFTRPTLSISPTATP